jgi:hypothetical protein
VKLQRDGPKRRRRTRRDCRANGGLGDERRWGHTIGNFKAEREARRAGLTGKITKHVPDRIWLLMYGRPVVSVTRPLPPGEYTVLHQFGQLWVVEAVTLPSGASAPPEREAAPTRSRTTERGGEEEEQGEG